MTFEVEQGEIVALIGPSGCGKSTLLRCINRMNDSPTVTITGGLHVAGHDAQDPDTDVIALRRDVGMVFQRPNPLPLSIRDNVLFGVRLHAPRTPRKLQEELVEDALQTVGLWDQVKDKLGSHAEALPLDGRQKLCIARLLPLKPRVLLMDEPCSALDPDGIGAIEELMAELRGRYTQSSSPTTCSRPGGCRTAAPSCSWGSWSRPRPRPSSSPPRRNERTARYIEGRYG